MADKQSRSSVSNDELASIIEREVSQSIGHWDGQLASERTLELDYYNSKPFGNEIEGESQVVSSDVSDTVEGLLPSLLKIFTASDDVVRFDPRGPEDEDAAHQQTETVNYVFYQQNNGFLVLYEWFKDALIQKNGVVKYWWEDKQEWIKERFQGLTEGQYLTLMKGDGDPESIEELSHETYDDPIAAEQRQTVMQKVAQLPPEAQADPQFAQVQMMLQQPLPQLHNVEVKVRKDKSKVCVQAIPPEEFGVSSKHKSVTLQDTPFCYHRTRMTISDLRAAGYEESLIMDIGSGNTGNQSEDLSQEAMARDRFVDQMYRTDESADDTMREVWVTDAYIRLDMDGDGIAELRHVVMAGNVVLENEECDHIPFAAITPVIMPHRFVGRSVAELVMDIQLIKSTIWRQMLNNLYLTNNPRKVVLSSASGIVQANLDDLMNSAPGGIVREFVPNAVRDLEVPFVAGASFPMLEYMDGMKENRTGQSRYNQGTDADSLNKMLDLDTPVPMADGTYKTMGTVETGDFVIGGDGLAVRVEMAHPIQMPERAYRLKFKSGDEIIAGGEHLWHVMTQRNMRDGISQILNTDALAAKDLKEGHAYHWNVPRVWGAEFEEKDLPLDPYIFGLWLGDGAQHSGRITTCDDEILQALEDWADQNGGKVVPCNDGKSGIAETYRISALGPILVRMGAMRYKDSGEKHIPDAYLRGSYAQRLALLQGLMDTDGCAHSDGAMSIFCQKEGRLLNDVLKLIESLGGWPRAREVEITESMFPTDNKHFQVAFSLQACPFRLKRKAARHIPPQRCVTSQPIVDIEPVEIRPMRCITVAAADGLYCVGKRFTVTHNTARGISLIQQAGQQRQDLIARIFAETGVKDLMRGIKYMLSKYSTRPMTIRLRNKWVDVDPREWRTEYDMTVNVGLGTGNKDQQLAHLNVVNQQQLELMKSGRGHLVTDENVFNLFRKSQEAMGFKHPEMFISDPRNVQKPQPQMPPEVMKLQLDAKQGEAKLQQAAQMRQFDAQTNKTLEEMRQQTQIAIAKIQEQGKKEIELMRQRHAAEMAVFENNSKNGEANNALELKAMQLSQDEQMLALKKEMDRINENYRNQLQSLSLESQEESQEDREISGSLKGTLDALTKQLGAMQKLVTKLAKQKD